MHRSAGLTSKGAGAVKAAADSVPSRDETQEEKLQTQANALEDTKPARPADPLAALGKVMSSSDDDETYPGLEKPLVKQQELRQ